MSRPWMTAKSGFSDTPSTVKNSLSTAWDDNPEDYKSILKVSVPQTTSRVQPAFPPKRKSPWVATSSGPKKLKRQQSLKETLPVAPKHVGPFFSLSKEQCQVLELAKTGESIFFTGAAGTGKSFLLSHIIEALKKRYKQQGDFPAVQITSSTGLAAISIGGTTLHRFAGIGLGDADVKKLFTKIMASRTAKSRWTSTRVLIIDEISMVDGELFTKIEEIARLVRGNQAPFGGIQLIVTGDFFQLPPINKRTKATYVFETAAWTRCISKSLVLEEVFRQKGDSRFINILNAMRRGLLTREMNDTLQRLSRPITYPDGLEPTELYAIRDDVARSNARRLKQLKGTRYIYAKEDSIPATVDSAMADRNLNDAFSVSPALELCIDCQVMVMRNLPELELANGTLGRVIGFLTGDEYFKLITEAGDKNISLNGSDFERMVRAAQAKMEARMKLATMNKHVQMHCNNTIVNVSCAGAALQSPTSSQTTSPLASVQLTKLPLPIVRFSLDPQGAHNSTEAVPPFRYELAVTKKNNIKETATASRIQIPLIHSWAMSIHKAQGQTLPRVKVDLGKIFENGHAYVAISRATSMDSLQILNYRREKVTVDAKVADFYRKIKDHTEQKNAPKASPQSTITYSVSVDADDGFD